MNMDMTPGPDTEQKPIENLGGTIDGTTKRSTRFWFDDGNVILQAEATQFRVHRSLLTLHSEILRDCFAVPQPKDTIPVEGCIFVHLPDSSKDIENMCALLYGLYHLEIDNTDSSYLQTMIRLGRKYEISYFKTAALKHLRTVFPRTLSEWYSKQPIVASFLKGGNDLFLFDIINVAYECNLMSILPAAFLSLCTSHDLEQILQRDFSSDSTKTLLDMQPLLDCMKGRTTFMYSFLSEFVSLYRPTDPESSRYAYNLPSADCEHKHKCSKTFQILFGDLIVLGAVVNEGTISFTKDMESDLPNIVTNLCHKCRSALQYDFSICRNNLWERLPKCFNLPPWTKMEDFDADQEVHRTKLKGKLGKADNLARRRRFS